MTNTMLSVNPHIFGANNETTYAINKKIRVDNIGRRETLDTYCSILLGKYKFADFKLEGNPKDVSNTIMLS